MRTSNRLPSLVALLSLLVACKADIPDGVLACSDTENCPSGYSCKANGLGTLRCFAGVGSDPFDGAVADATITPMDAQPPPTLDAMPLPLDAEPPAPVDGSSSDAAGDAMRVPGCIPEVADTAGAVFVAPDGIVASCGMPLAPCSTIAQGIKRALYLRASVINIDTGIYAELVELPAGITLRGGWDNKGSMWTRKCTSDRSASAVIESPENVGVEANKEGASVLDTLTVRTAPATAGVSQYGIRVIGASTQLALVDVSVTAMPGGDGTSPPQQPATPDASGTCLVGNGAAGTPGAPGAGASAGTFERDGYVASAGADGQAGGVGASGTMSSDGAVESCLAGGGTCGRSAASICGPSISDRSSRGAPGIPGCGGPAGTGGSGGGGGGSSFGIYVASSSVTIAGGAVRAGNGGAAGAGGLGGAGGAGSTGAAGAPGDLCTMCEGRFLPGGAGGIGGSVKVVCTSVESASPGSNGNPGGAGGAGGVGGAGAAGSSFAVYKVGAAQVSISPTTILEHGSAGASTGNGAVGAAGVIGSSPL